jgi:DNA-binding XRE family transcriptional regulator
MSRIVTIYKTVCYSAQSPDRELESCSLLPWRNTDEANGTDDGGRDYVLPAHYRQGKDASGGPAVFAENGRPCRVMLHDGRPLLVDEDRQLAFLLEPVKKMASYREAAGLTREEMASRLGVTQKELFEWENLEKEPDSKTLARIAEILGCSPGDFR